MNRRILLFLLVLAAATGPLTAILGDTRDGRPYSLDPLFGAMAIAVASLQLRRGRRAWLPRREEVRTAPDWRLRNSLRNVARFVLAAVLLAFAAAGRAGPLPFLLPAGLRALRRPKPGRTAKTMRDSAVVAFAGLVLLGSPASLLGAVAATLLLAALLPGLVVRDSPHATRTSAWAVPATAVAAALLFLLVPRFGDRAAEEPSAAATRRERAVREGRMPPGEFVPATALRRVAIGDIGRLQRDMRPLLEVEVVRRGVPADAEDLGPLFRGGALEEFDGTTWRSEDPSVLRRDDADGTVDGFVHLPPRRLPAGEVVEQRLRFVVGGTDSLFCLGMPVAVGGETAGGRVRLLPRGEVRAADSYSDGALFTLRSVAAPGDFAVVDAEAISDARRDRLLQIPPGHGRAAAWARTQLAGAGGGARLLRRVDAVLSRQCTYSTDLRTTPGATAVEGFLFGSRRGHCELFASAAAVMLRAVGVPSRVVIGFRGGIWDPLAKKYVLRGADAHAWAEGWIEGEGWRTLDATPAANAPPRDDAEADAAAAEEGTASRVLRYDAEAQRRFLLGAVRLVGDLLGNAFTDADGRPRLLVALTVSLALTLLAGALLLRRPARVVEPPAAAALVAVAPPEAWTLLLRTLADAGIRRAPSETAAELAARAVAAGAAPSDAVFAVAAAYSEERWGGRAPDARAREGLRELAAGIALLTADRGRSTTS